MVRRLLATLTQRKLVSEVLSKKIMGKEMFPKLDCFKLYFKEKIWSHPFITVDKILWFFNNQSITKKFQNSLNYYTNNNLKTVLNKSHFIFNQQNARNMPKILIFSIYNAVYSPSQLSCNFGQ